VSELPLFPLHTVLFPDGLLPLRIFEARYVDMVSRCLREATAQTAELGTTARIVDFSKLPDGLLGITCKGERKFRVLKRWQRDDGLYVGDVEYLAPEAVAEVPGKYGHLAELLRRVLPQLGEPYAGMAGRFEDASWVGCRLTEILPLSVGDKLSLLELDDPVARLRLLARLVQEVPR
jgi:uncharacterized protein